MLIEDDLYAETRYDVVGEFPRDGGSHPWCSVQNCVIKTLNSTAPFAVFVMLETSRLRLVDLKSLC
jgi:hypothetical protein